MLRIFIGIFLIWGIGLGAQPADDEMQVFADDLAACFFTGDTSEAQRECIGDMAVNCMDADEGGYTTLGMSTCASAEADVWDTLLNFEYKETMAWAKASDADEAINFPEHANRVESLLAAQRAWIEFRDTNCSLRYALWGAGSMRHIAGSNCIMEMIAEQTIKLREMREMFE